jgi:hypothetical protein
MIRVIYVFIFLGFSFTLFPQCDSVSLQIREIRASDTDNTFSWELHKHFTYFNTSCSQRNLLLVHLVGSYDNPTNTQIFPSLAANNGFHALVLKYPNSTAAQSACGSSLDIDCYKNFRKEIIEGIDVSPDISVDFTNSITNRLIKLIQYMTLTYPSENWEQYLVNGQIQWQNIIVSGHSQGGGHAAYIAKTHQVKRCLMFASPNDFINTSSSPANWVSSSSQTPDSLFYGFNNLNDDVVPFINQYQVWTALPMINDTLCVDNTSNYLNKTQLYTQLTILGTGGNHSLVIRDSETPYDLQGNYLFEPVWSYMLGIDEGLAVDDEPNYTFSIYPNPANHSIQIKSNINENFTLSIYTIEGIIVKQINTNQSSVINISDLDKGVYLVKISNNSHQLIRKIVKL